MNSVRLGQILPFAEPGGAVPLDRLLQGDVDAAISRASDVVGLEHEHPDLRFVVPDEGGLLLTDIARVSFDTANPVGANAYLDYVDTPEHAADRYRSLPVMWPLDRSTTSCDATTAGWRAEDRHRTGRRSAAQSAGRSAGPPAFVPAARRRGRGAGSGIVRSGAPPAG